MKDQDRITQNSGQDPRVPAIADDRRYVSAAEQYLAPDDQRKTGNDGLDLRYYINTAFKHRYLITVVVATSVLFALIISLLATRYYTAEASIQIDQQSLKVVEGKDVLQNQGERDFINTQLQVLKSRKLAERVVNRLGLDRDKVFMGESSFSKMFSVSRIISLFLEKEKNSTVLITKRKLAATFKVMDNAKFGLLGRTRIVTITYTHSSPVHAQRIVNAITASYLQLNLDRKIEASSYAKNFLEDQLSILRVKLQDSEKELVNYAEKNRIIDIEDKESLAGQQLRTADISLGKAVSERIKAEFAWKQALNSPVLALTQVTQNKFIEKLRTEHAELQSKYQDQLATFRPSYPNMVSLRARINQVEKTITQETKNIKQSLKATYEAAKNQEDLAILRVEQLKTEVLGLSRRSIQYNILRREVATNRSLYEGLLNRYKQIGVAGGVGANNVSVVDRALLPVAHSSPQLKLNLLISMVLGLLGGIGLVFLKEFFDDTVKGPGEVEELTRAVSLGVIPITAANETIDELLLDPMSIHSEAYRSLATALQFSTGGGVPKTLFFTSAQPSEGKSSTVMALSRHFSKVGMQVLLIDCDLRNPSLHKRMGLDNSIGLSNYLSGGCRAPDAIQNTDDPNFMFIGTGPLPPNPAELLNHPRMITLLSIASEKFDLVIIDGPPVMGLADAPIVSSIAAGTIFIVAAGQSKSELIRRAVGRLRFSRAKIIGTLTTKFDAQQGAYDYDYDYGYSYGDQSTYGEIVQTKKDEAVD